MVDNVRRVRGTDGLLDVRDRSYSLEEIKRWREIEYLVGHPSSLQDFYAAHGICPKCAGDGVYMTGWSDPKGTAELKAAEALNSKQLPVYAVCESCGGSGAWSLE